MSPFCSVCSVYLLFSTRVRLTNCIFISVCNALHMMTVPPSRVQVHPSDVTRTLSWEFSDDARKFAVGLPLPSIDVMTKALQRASATTPPTPQTAAAAAAAATTAEVTAVAKTAAAKAAATAAAEVQLGNNEFDDEWSSCCLIRVFSFSRIAFRVVDPCKSLARVVFFCVSVLLVYVWGYCLLLIV